MPDLVVRHIDDLMVERIKTLAKDRRWSINDVVLHALRHGLGMSAAGQITHESQVDPGTLVLGGQWDLSEKAVFQEALQALSMARPSALSGHVPGASRSANVPGGGQPPRGAR